MPDTPTPKRGYLRPKLGKKPWKKEWDFNWGKADDDVGGLLDGTKPAGKALSIDPTALIAAIIEITGDLGASTFLDATSIDTEVDHTGTLTYALPAEPIFLAPGGVKIIPLSDRTALTTADYGGKFRVRVENNSGGAVNGTSITWKRRGIKT